MTELRRIRASTVLPVVFKASLHICAVIFGTIAAVWILIGLPIAFIFKAATPTQILIGTVIGITATALIVLFGASVMAICTYIQCAIYNGIAWLIGGFKYTLKKKGTEQEIVSLDMKQALKWWGISSLFSLVLVLCMYSLMAAFGQAPFETFGVLIHTASPFAGLFLLLLLQFAVTFAVVIFILYLYNKFSSSMPIRVTISATRGKAEFRRINVWPPTFWVWVLYTFMQVTTLILTALGVFPLSAHSTIISTIIASVIVIVFTPLVWALNYALINWSLKKYGPILIELT